MVVDAAMIKLGVSRVPGQFADEFNANSPGDTQEHGNCVVEAALGTAIRRPADKEFGEGGYEVGRRREEKGDDARAAKRVDDRGDKCSVAASSSHARVDEAHEPQLVVAHRGTDRLPHGQRLAVDHTDVALQTKHCEGLFALVQPACAGR